MLAYESKLDTGLSLEFQVTHYSTDEGLIENKIMEPEGEGKLEQPEQEGVEQPEQPEHERVEQSEQPEQEEEVEKKIKRRGPNKNPTKTSDPEYFKNYYREKWKPKLFTEENKVRCERCNKLSYKHSLTRHQKSNQCFLTQYRTERDHTVICDYLIV
jgi:hypothetical protein